MEGKANSLTDIVLNHFDAYQREGHQSSLKQSRHSISAKANGSIEARVAKIKEEISFFLLNSAVGDISISSDADADNNNNSNNREEEVQQEILEAVLKVVDVAMVTEIDNSNQESVDRILELIASFTCFVDQIHLPGCIVDRVVQFSGVTSEQIRSQACKLLGLCVEKLRMDKARIDEHDTAKEALLVRVTDKSQAVRNAAIKACGSFFAGPCDTTEEQEYNDVKNALLWSMEHDPSLANRSAALWSVPLSEEDTIDKVISRVRDVKSKVRVEALEAIRTNANIMFFSQEQLASLLRSGLTERCSSTREAAIKMVCTTWMKSVKFDPVALIELAGPIVYERECEKMIRTILDVASDHNQDILDDFSDPERRAFRGNVEKACSLQRQNAEATELDVAQVLFARVCCDHADTFTGMKKADILTKVIPDIPALCEMFQQKLAVLVESIKTREADEDETQAQTADDLEDEICFTCIQLLRLAKISGLEEEGSRRHFIAVMKDVLASLDTPDDLLEECIQAIGSAHDNEAHFLQTVSEILANLSDVTSEEQVTVKDLEACLQLRIVSILSIVLENLSPRMATSPILQNFSGYILPSITHTNSMVRECGISTLGRYALLSTEETVIEEVKPLLLKVAGNSEERLEIRGQASLALCDLALLYSEILEPCEVESETVLFAAIIKSMLDHSKPAVVAIAAEVTAKLLFAGKLHDSYLLAQLLVVFFRADFLDPSMEEEDERVKEVGSIVRLQQLLTVFFPAYSIKSHEGRETLLRSIASFVGIVNDKQTQIGSMSWPVTKMIEYVCSTVDIGVKQGMDKPAVDQEDGEEKSEGDMEHSREEESIHTTSSTLSASIAVSDFIIKEGTSIGTAYLRALCKFLGGAYIDVESDNEIQLAILKKKVNELEMLITDGTSSRALQKMNDALSSINSEDEDEDESDEDEDEDESDEESLAEAMKAIALSEASEGKENAAEIEAVPKSRKSTDSRVKRHLTQVNYCEAE